MTKDIIKEASNQAIINILIRKLDENCPDWANEPRFKLLRDECIDRRNAPMYIPNKVKFNVENR